MSRTRGKSGSGPGKNELNPVGGGSGQSTSDVTGVGMSNSNSQPDLLGDIVNKSNGGGSEQSSLSPVDDDAADIKKNTNGFHIEMATESSTATTTTTNPSDLPDISNVVIANSNADSINSNANNKIGDEHVVA